jgi:hypothetical protein
LKASCCECPTSIIHFQESTKLPSALIIPYAEIPTNSYVDRMGIVPEARLAHNPICNGIARLQQLSQIEYRTGRPQGPLPGCSVTEEVQEAS